MAKRRFTSENSAKSFAAKVNGEFKDLRDIEGSKSNFVVKYTPNEKTKKAWNNADNSNDWSPEEGRDFGYPNEFWQ